MSNERPSYLRVFMTFARNSLVREMTFRSNFLIQCVSSLSWTLMNVGFYLIVFSHAKQIGPDSGWGKYEFFVFLGTTMLVNSLVQAFFMPNVQEFSEMIRSGNLDFALLKPIDTQFSISLQRIDWAALINFVAGIVLVTVALVQLTTRPENPIVVPWAAWLLYPFYIVCGVAIMYGVMLSLSATSIWLGRNQTLYNFWFYITNFSRYPMEIYGGTYGTPLRILFTFVIPVLIVVNVPARVMAQPLHPEPSLTLPLALFAVVATLMSLLVSRGIFQLALRSYRSASS